MTISGDEEELMVVVDRRTQLARWSACGGVALLLWGLFALSNDLVTIGILVSGRPPRRNARPTGCTGLRPTPSSGRLPHAPLRPRPPRLYAAARVRMAALLFSPRPAVCPWPTLAGPGFLQVDFFESANFASPEVQQDLYEIDPDAWRRQA